MAGKAMNKIFSDFAGLLHSRVDKGVYTTEDSVRYTLFASMLQNKICANQILLESPHPEIDRAQVDTWLPNFEGKVIAIEFKYDRESSGVINKTNRAGAKFEDIRRLQLANRKSGAECYFVYLTSIEMHKYFCNSSNRHDNFYNLPEGESLDINKDYLADRPNSFSAKIRGELGAKVVNILNMSLPREHFLRVYQVSSI